MKIKIENGMLEIKRELALEIGLNESIVLQQVYIRVQTSKTMIDGKRWFQHSYEQWQEVFPFWSISTIKRTLVSLNKKGLVLIEQHSKHQYDRTNWYAISEETLRKMTSLNQDITNNDNEELHYGDKQINEDTHQKYMTVKKRLKELRFFPLKKQQREELINVCKTYSVEQIIHALEQTAAKCIYAWKYAYKVLITSVQAQKQWSPRKIIRSEIVPDWFQKRQEETRQPEETEEDFLVKKRRLEAIQMKYRKNAMANSMSY